MLYPLLLMIGAATLGGSTLHLYTMRTEIMRRRVRTLTIREAERLDSGARRIVPAPAAARASSSPVGSNVFDLGSHGGFIVAAYAFTALIMCGLVGNALRDRAAQRRALKRFGEDRR